MSTQSKLFFKGRPSIAREFELRKAFLGSAFFRQWRASSPQGQCQRPFRRPNRLGGKSGQDTCAASHIEYMLVVSIQPGAWSLSERLPKPYFRAIPVIDRGKYVEDKPCV